MDFNEIIEKIQSHKEVTATGKKSCIFCQDIVPENTSCLRIASSSWQNRVNFRIICPKCFKYLIFEINPALLRPNLVKEIKLNKVINKL